MKNVTDIFTKLVQIDSPSGHEEKMGAYLTSWLKNNKFQFKTDAVGNIYAKRNGSGSPLLLSGHMDTVSPGIGIKPIIKNGVITSSGDTILGADNKAALAAIIAAVEECAPERSLELLFTVKEETGGGVEHFPFKWISSKQAIIADSSNPLGGIVLRSPSIYNFHATFTGKAAHASKPEKGVNACIPLAEVLSSIEVGSLDDDDTTINIGCIAGGSGINTIPEHASLSGEVRSYDSSLFKKHLKHIESVCLSSAKKTNTVCNYSQDGYCAGYTHSQNTSLVKKLEEIMHGLNIPVEFYTNSGISDANVLNAHGIITVNIADGTENPHTTQEQISVTSLQKLTEIMKACIIHL